jgi:hypothetical protein
MAIKEAILNAENGTGPQHIVSMTLTDSHGARRNGLERRRRKCDESIAGDSPPSFHGGDRRLGTEQCKSPSEGVMSGRVWPALMRFSRGDG